MTKLDITPIICDHYRSMHVKGRFLPLIGNVIIFIAVPILCASSSYKSSFSVGRDSFNVTITFFGIFVALLLNIQVAVFAILQRKWEAPQDSREAELLRKKAEQRRVALGEFNANLSYLTLFCCCALAVFFPAYVFDAKGPLFSAFAVFIYVHFILTLLLCIRASHALFQKEYGRA